MSNKYIIAIHPISYQEPIFYQLSIILREENSSEIEVLYLDDHSLKKTYYPELGISLKLDHDLIMNGYKYQFIRNFRITLNGLLSRVNPGLFKYLFQSRSTFLVHGYMHLSTFLFLIFAPVFGHKIIFRGEMIELDGVKNVQMKQKIKYYVKKIILKFLFKNVSAFIYSCEPNKRVFGNYCNSNTPMFLAPCAVNNEKYRELYVSRRNNKKSYRDKFNISEDEIVILFVGRFTKRKRFNDIITSLGHIGLQNSFVCLFVGAGPELENLQNQAVELNVKVIFPGFLSGDELFSCYISADIFIIPSEYDNSPKVLNEAMNFSLPVIVSNGVGTINELVVQGVNGYVYPVGDIEELSKCIKNFVDYDVRKKFGRESQNIVSKSSFYADAVAFNNAFNSINKVRG